MEWSGVFWPLRCVARGGSELHGTARLDPLVLPRQRKTSISSCMQLRHSNCFLLGREEHIIRKVDQVVVEAKAKLAKGDKKGKYLSLSISIDALMLPNYATHSNLPLISLYCTLCCLLLLLSSLLYRSFVRNETKKDVRSGNR
jgi:hypothetical protein